MTDAAALRLAAALVLTMAQAGLAQESPPQVDFEGRLYRSVFSSGAGVLTPRDVQNASEPLRGRLERYLARRAAVKSQYKGTAKDLQSMRSDAKKRVLERAMVALIDVPGIERIAAQVLVAAPVAHEWDALPERPLAEAVWAEDVLKKDPASPLAPFWYVFIAERQRVLFEAYENQQNQDGMRTAARKYRAFVERARSAADPIFHAIVEDMERLPFLYIKGKDHPRDFDPDT